MKTSPLRNNENFKLHQVKIYFYLTKKRCGIQYIFKRQVGTQDLQWKFCGNLRMIKNKTRNAESTVSAGHGGQQ